MVLHRFTKILRNQRGVTLIELVAASAISLIALGFMGQLIQQNSKALVKARQQVQRLNIETLLSQGLSDSRTCNCTINTNLPGHPFRALNGGRGIEAPPTAATSTTGSPPPIPMSYLSLFRADTQGQCHFTTPNHRLDIAATGLPLPGGAEHIVVESINIEELARVNAVTTDLNLNRGKFVVRLLNTLDPSDNVGAMEMPFSFYSDGSHQVLGCSLGEEVRQAYDQQFLGIVNDQLVLANNLPGGSSNSDFNSIWCRFMNRVDDYITNQGYTQTSTPARITSYACPAP